ncbi:MAG TPA: hypothetical protein VFE37_29970 [Chloroflexota bacterium]|nr:hypothetical protein [Chloroflexota bacterium]
MKRPLPRPFAFPWGAGEVVEEVSVPAGVDGHTWEPTVQLLAYADGGMALRFCYYDAQGRFGRGPMLLRPADVAPLRAALAEAPRIRALLRELAE